jgi:hypothetical protein
VPASPLRALEPCPHRGVRLGDRRPGAGLRRGLVPLVTTVDPSSAAISPVCPLILPAQFLYRSHAYAPCRYAICTGMINACVQ